MSGYNYLSISSILCCGGEINACRRFYDEAVIPKITIIAPRYANSGAPWVSQLQPSVLSRVRDCSTERLNASTSFETFDSAEGGEMARSEKNPLVLIYTHS